MDDVDFDRALKKYDGDLKITYYTFSMKPTELTIRKFVLRENDAGDILGHVFEFEIYAKWLDRQETFPGWDQYTGWMRILELDGNVLSEKRMEDGKGIDSKGNKNLSSRGPVAVCSRSEVYWYNCTRTASNPNWTCDYTHTTVTTDCTWESLSHDGILHNGRPRKNGIESIDFDEWEKKQLNAIEENVVNNLTGVPLCVYNKLEDGDLFKKTIGAFIDDPEYDLTLQVGDCNNTNDACTNAKDVKNIIITIEDVNQSPLGIAALILHEGIHAEIHRYISRYESGVDPNNRARLLQLYAYYKGWAAEYQDDDFNWKQVAHHSYMVENYVKKIASAVRELDNKRYPLDYYMSYAWDGLRDSGYTAKRLTSQQNTYYQNLRKVSDENTKTCK